MAGRPVPDLTSSIGVTPHPGRMSMRPPCPVSGRPDPRITTHDVVSVDPDMEPARAGRSGDNDRWRRRRGIADLDGSNNGGAGHVGYDDTAGREHDHKKTSAEQKIFNAVHSLPLPSTERTRSVMTTHFHTKFHLVVFFIKSRVISRPHLLKALRAQKVTRVVWREGFYGEGMSSMMRARASKPSDSASRARLSASTAMRAWLSTGMLSWAHFLNG
jgi:hypothetical protein